MVTNKKENSRGCREASLADCLQLSCARDLAAECFKMGADSKEAPKTSTKAGILISGHTHMLPSTKAAHHTASLMC